MVGTVPEADAFEGLDGEFGGVLAGNGSGDGDIFQGGELGKEVVVLEDVADALVAEAGLLLAAHGVEVGAVDVDAALFRVFESGEGVEQGGFPGSAGAAEEDFLALADLQVDAVEHLDGFPPDAVAAVEVHGFDHDVLHGREVGGCSSTVQAPEFP